MIKTLEIIINNGIFENIKLLLIYDKNICYKNDKKYLIDNNWKDELIRTIRTWKEEYGYDNNIDSEEFTITIISDRKEKIHGKGIFPNNYHRLIELLGEIHD